MYPIDNSITYRQEFERTWQATHGHYCHYRMLDPDTARELRLARKRADLTLREAGRRAGISASFLSRLERGLRAPRLTTVMRLERVLDLDERTVERLIEGAG